MDALQYLLVNGKIKFACIDLKRLIKLYQSDPNVDKDLIRLLLKSTLNNKYLPNSLRVRYIRVILNNWNMINDPELMNIIKDYVHVLIISILSDSIISKYTRKKYINKIITIIKNIENNDEDENNVFALSSIIIQAAVDDFKKHNKLRKGYLGLIIKSPQSIGGDIIREILQFILSNDMQKVTLTNSKYKQLSESESTCTSNDISSDTNTISSCINKEKNITEMYNAENLSKISESSDIDKSIESSENIQNNLGLITRINDKNIINPEIDNSEMYLNDTKTNLPNLISNNMSKNELIEILFVDICNCILEDNEFDIDHKSIDAYDEIFSPIINSGFLCPEKILATVYHLHNNSLYDIDIIGCRLIECIFNNCNEELMQQIAAYVPIMYITLMSKDITKTILFDIFKNIMRHTVNYMDNDTVEQLIMNSHGIPYGIMNKLSQELTHTLDTHKIKSTCKKSTYEIKSACKKNKRITYISHHLFNIKIIRLINDYFPLQLMRLIRTTIFTKYICIFKNTKYSTSIKKKLIEYTNILNEWGYLPYDSICDALWLGNNISNIGLCPICLHDTNWRFTSCNHAICRRCFISNAYTNNNINTVSFIVFRNCITCNTIKGNKCSGKGKAYCQKKKLPETITLVVIVMIIMMMMMIYVQPGKYFNVKNQKK